MKTYLEFLIEKVTMQELESVETRLNRFFHKIGVDVEFSRHFLERVNDPRNNPEISAIEIEKTFLKAFASYNKEFSKFTDGEIERVIFDVQRDLNIPVITRFQRRKKGMELFAKTIMRKKNFRSPDPKLEV